MQYSCEPVQRAVTMNETSVISTARGRLSGKSLPTVPSLDREFNVNLMKKCESVIGSGEGVTAQYWDSLTTVVSYFILCFVEAKDFERWPSCSPGLFDAAYQGGMGRAVGGIFTADGDTERVFRCVILAFLRQYEVLLLCFCRFLVLHT